MRDASETSLRLLVCYLEALALLNLLTVAHKMALAVTSPAASDGTLEAHVTSCCFGAAASAPIGTILVGKQGFVGTDLEPAWEALYVLFRAVRDTPGAFRFCC